MAKKTSSYQDFVKSRMPQLRKKGLSPADAMKQIGEEWSARKARGGGGSVGNSRETRVTGGLRSLKAEVPLVVQANPDIAAAWDIAAGILDYLEEQATELDPYQSAARRAAVLRARAKGESSEADTAEVQMGRAIGEVLISVMVHRGMTGAQWDALRPKQLRPEGGALTDAAEGLLGLLGLSVDLDKSGTQGTLSGLASAAAQAATGGSAPAEAGGQAVLDFITGGGQ